MSLAVNIDCGQQALSFSIAERRAIMFTIFCLFAAYLITYPWPFLSETIPYKHHAPIHTNSTTSGGLKNALNDDNDESNTGCDLDKAWCATTPRVHAGVFLGSLITVLGFAIPVLQINLDILYSKILGDIR